MEKWRSGRKCGFTLVDLLVVITVIAILAAILFPVFMAAKKKGQQANCMGNLCQLGKALETYISLYGRLGDGAYNTADAWWPYVEQGIEAIVMTASGCGVMVKEYGELLKRDPRYGAKAERISRLTKDASEILCAEREAIGALYARTTRSTSPKSRATRVAFHSPCTLQHGQQIRGAVEALLQRGRL